jgi:GntR family transcriptional regulator
MKLNRNDAVPLHLQIQSLIRDQIARGIMSSGSAVPSERELAEDLHVSRMTVRQAFKSLREEGLIYQKRGKGTFVSPFKLDIHTRDLNGFSDEMRRRGMKPVSKVLKMEKTPASAEAAAKLKLDEGEKVFQIERLRIADRIPMSLETTCLPVKMFPDLDRYNFEKSSLYQILEKSYGVQMISAEETLEAAISGKTTSELLGVKKNSPLLVVHRTVFADANLPIEYAISIYRADRYRATFFLVKK